MLTERTRTSPEAVLLCSQSRLSDTPKLLWIHWFSTHCFLQFSRHVHDHFSFVLEVLYLLLSEHEFPLLHGSPTHDAKPCLWDLVQTFSDVLHGHGGKVLVARVVCTTRDLHTDAHLELVLILVLSLCWTSSCACSWQCSCVFFCTCSSLRLSMLFSAFARVPSSVVGLLFSALTC